MAFQVLFLSSFLAGLVLTVTFMLLGVERSSRGSRASILAADADGWRRVVADAQRQISARLGLPSIAAFATAFGAVGYLLTRYTEWSPPLRLVAALVAGGLAVASTVGLVAKWAIPGARREVVDERYLLQGHLARVTAAIERERPGQISYVVDGRTFSTRALGLDGMPARAGTDVVIERIENGCAYVEPWSVVERRL